MPMGRVAIGVIVVAAAVFVAPQDRARAQGAAPDAEVVFWQSIAESNDPAEFEAYLDLYPEGNFAALARIRLARMGRAAPPTAAPVPPTAAPVPRGAESDEAPVVTAVLVAKVRFATKNANVRAAPSTKAKRVTTLPAGAMVQVRTDAPVDDWYDVTLSDGRTGFVYAPLLSEDPKHAGTGALDALGDIGDVGSF